MQFHSWYIQSNQKALKTLTQRPKIPIIYSQKDIFQPPPRHYVNQQPQQSTTSSHIHPSNYTRALSYINHRCGGKAWCRAEDLKKKKKKITASRSIAHGVMVKTRRLIGAFLRLHRSAAPSLLIKAHRSLLGRTIDSGRFLALPSVRMVRLSSWIRLWHEKESTLFCTACCVRY